MFKHGFAGNYAAEKISYWCLSHIYDTYKCIQIFCIKNQFEIGVFSVQIPGQTSKRKYESKYFFRDFLSAYSWQKLSEGNKMSMESFSKKKKIFRSKSPLPLMYKIITHSISGVRSYGWQLILTDFKCKIQTGLTDTV